MSDSEKPVKEKVKSTREVDVTKVRDSWLWIKDSRGYGSVTVTFVTIAFWVTTIAYVLSLVEKIGPVAIRPFDVGACSAYFIPILTLYFGRKFTEAKFDTLLNGDK
jgi:hypothetical protein